MPLAGGLQLGRGLLPVTRFDWHPDVHSEHQIGQTLAVRVDREGEALRFTTNVGDEVEAGPDNPIRVEMDRETGEPRPYLHVRRGLEALIARPVFYELVEMAREHEGRMAVSSNGAWFAVGPLA